MEHIKDIIQNNDLASIQKLIYEHGINQKYEHDLTLIHYAIMYGNFELVEYLIVKGINLESVDNFGQTPLIYTIIYNKLTIFSLLIKNNVNINKSNFANQSPILIAISKMQTKMVNILLEEPYIKYDNNIIFNLVKYHINDALFKILHYENNFFITDSKKNSILHIATLYNNQDLIKYCISNRVYINFLNNDLEPPIFNAAKNRNLECISYLLNNGAYINITNKYNETIFDITNDFTKDFINYKINEIGYIKIIKDELLFNLIVLNDLAKIKSIITKNDLNIKDFNNNTLYNVSIYLNRREISSFLKQFIRK